jgi:hypothetical protein
LSCPAFIGEVRRLTLELEVCQQLIYRYDCQTPVSDSREYLYAHFVLASDDWQAAPTRIMVVTRAGMDPAREELDAGGRAKVPDALLVNAGRDCIELGLALVGYGADGLVITTAPIAVTVYASGYTESGPASELPPDVAQQIYAELERLRAYVAERGVTFVPSVSEDGIISWTNDGGRPNPEPVDIRGPAGAGDDSTELGADKVLSIWQQYAT